MAWTVLILSLLVTIAMALEWEEYVGVNMKLLYPPARDILDWSDSNCGGRTYYHEFRVWRHCAPCGDNIQQTKPRDHEVNGFWSKYANTTTVKRNSWTSVSFILAPPAGWVDFRICNLDKQDTEDNCFRIIKMSSCPYNEQESMYVSKLPGNVSTFNEYKVHIPNWACEKCVLRLVFKPIMKLPMTNQPGKTMVFMSCADIRIK